MTATSARTASSPAVARLLAVCVLLAGLFLMHGSPAAAEGCHGDTAGGASPSGGAAALPHHDMSTSTIPVAGDSTGPAVRAGLPSPAHHAVRVSTPEHGPLLLPALTVFALMGTAAMWVLTGRTTGLSAARRRAPPGGRPLLLQVCIARM
ncbi:hypothetical protein V1460_15470 [Streptomyces sp. SCSIO 30461]|uniref:hypothetical protein n=1 Tax=Streptomyces sp. SCSIO 30461 TaxID=3118085 RepID=UPI0030CAACC3